MVRKLVSRYLKDEVAVKSAAMAYYLLFTLFPLLVILSTMIGSFHIDYDSLQEVLVRFIPASMVGLITDYVQYVSANYSRTIMVFAIVFSIYFPFRVVKQLMKDVRRSFHQGPAKMSVGYVLKTLACTILFPLTIFFCLLLIVLGHNVISFISNLFLPGTVRISEFLLNLWQYLRFVLAALVMSLALTLLYEFSLDEMVPVKKLMPGIFYAVCVWIAASILFSVYVESYAHYSAIYGTFGVMIILMLWLYMTSVIFIMGSEYNGLKQEENFQKKTK